MKRMFIIVLSLTLISFTACKKEPKAGSTISAQKFAKYKISIRKDKELKDWLATLEKAEEVGLLEEFEHINAKNKTIVLAKVRLADDQEGYLEAKHLANQPVVFTNDTRAFSRPTPGSKVVSTIPKGSIGFILENKDTWSQVYVGKIDGKWISKHWVEAATSYSTDTSLIIDAREYEKALALIKEAKTDDAKKILTTLSGSTGSFFNELATGTLEELESGDGEIASDGESEGETSSDGEFEETTETPTAE